MSVFFQATSFCISAVGFILICVCVFTPYWKVNDPEDSLRDDIVNHQGLWIKCLSYSYGNWDCDDFNRFFINLPRSIQAARGMSLTSIALTVIGLGLMIFSIDGCLDSVSYSKKRLFRIAVGLCWILGAALIEGAVSWYGTSVYRDYEYSTRLRLGGTTVTRLVFGWSLFIGWIGGGILFFGGLLCLVTVCGARDYTNRSENYRYPMNQYQPRPAAVIRKDEYV